MTARMSTRTSADPEAWGPALLAILADHHGLACNPRDLRRHFEAEAKGEGLTLASLVEVADAFGFETQAGQLPSYDDLKGLSVLPAIVHLRQRVPQKMLALRGDGGFEDIGRQGRFVVVHQADEEGVDLEDPAAGRGRMPRAEFEDAWQGIVLCVAPTEDQAVRRASLFSRPRGLLGRIPPLALDLAGCGLLLAAGIGLAGPLGDRAGFALVGALALAFAASVWAIRSTARCAACTAAAMEVGLPLAPLGIVYYAGLLVVLGTAGPSPLTAIAILAAAGAHVAFLAQLAASGARCRACLLTAAAAWAASGLILGQTGWGWACAALPAGALLAGLAVYLLTRRTERLRRTMLASVRDVLAREDGPAPGRLRMIVYKHEACPKCRKLEADILPPLAGMLGERLLIERRPAGRQIPAPTLVFLGGARRLAIIGLPDGDDLREALAG